MERFELIVFDNGDEGFQMWHEVRRQSLVRQQEGPRGRGRQHGAQKSLVF